DEYQDTNFLQFRLIKILAGDSMNICVVGDDDQSIYGWRGAEVRNILDFSSHFPGTRIFKLEQNYRSTRTVLEAANAVISENEERHPKELWTNADDGEKIILCATDDEYSEAAFIAQKIEEIKYKNDRISYDDIVILYRSNYQSRTIEESLKGAQIPYRIVGAHSFYERREVKDAIAYLRLLVNPRDDQSFSRIIASPPRGLGNKAIEILRKEKSKNSRGFCELIQDDSVCAELGSKAAKSASELGKVIAKWQQEIQNPGKLARKAELYLKEVGYLDGLLQMYKDRDEALKRQENVFELINAMAAFEKSENEKDSSLIDFIERYSLNDDSDKVEDNADMKPAVTLMTVHSAKGLEFKVVFIVGMENGVFPHERSIDERGLDEERRLCYVALTRAKCYLYITYTNFRMKRGELSHQKPSIFLEAIPEELIENFQYSLQTRFYNRTARHFQNPYQRRFKKSESFISFDD
ncbi:MAG TPA: exodeoxyribonuclease V subunit gamma, partial [Victivallales bacterium]|nr:exodeoxyribonuclease V subunit gamma [Victivallales bacterium]